jgi:hypothetical protein
VVIDCVPEFLDKTDSTLAFAVFGAVQYDSYPIAVLAILHNQAPTGEFLLCFHGNLALLAFVC